MRVLHVYSGNLYGGIETMLVTLARQRAACPHLESHFALCFEDRLSGELRDAGAIVHPLDGVRVSRPWTICRARKRLAELLGRERHDAVICHSPWPHALFAPVVRRAGLPLLYWAHDVYTGRHWLEHWARRTPPDFILANSKLTQSALPNLFPGVPSEVLYLPVAPPEPLDRARTRRELRTELDTPADAVVLVMACRLERWKGHALLLAALARLAQVPGWVCWIAGGAQRPVEQEYLQELQRTRAHLGLSDRVHFLGQRRDVSRLLAAADIHCQPNTGPEPFGIAFIEALYAGLPVLTTALGGALEIVDQTCGILVPPGDEAALADAIAGLIHDGGRRQQLGAHGRARADALCNPARALQRLAEIVEQQLALPVTA